MSNGKQAKVQNEAGDFRRFIEESFPVKEVGEASAKEKSIRQGHISTLHIWWARRPLAASRATAYAALAPAPKDAEEWQKKRDFIIQLCQWENSNNQALLDRARREILEANSGVPPKVLDPFAGGGSYPLEALRLGCEAYANDYNPVAVLIEKATLEFPQKFGRPFEGMPKWAKGKRLDDERVEKSGKGTKKDKAKQSSLFDETTESQLTDSQSTNPLLNAVRYWGDWIVSEATKELEEIYPKEAGGKFPVAYIWARTIDCQNPSCGIQIPLVRQYWLVKKPNRSIALYPVVNHNKIEFKIVGNNYDKWPSEFDPDNGTIIRSVATCPVCGNVVDAEQIRKLFQDGKSGQRLIAIVFQVPNHVGKKYRVADHKDQEIYLKANRKLSTLSSRLLGEWGVSPVPDETLPLMSGVFNVPLYGVKTWGDLFNDRQRLAGIVFVEKIRSAYNKMSELCIGESLDYAKAVATYLAIILDSVLDHSTTVCAWRGGTEDSGHTFGRQALPMTWDYAEVCPISSSTGSWQSMNKQLLRVIDHLSIGCNASTKAAVTNYSATRLMHPDDYFDAVLTDPPYYNSVPYADLSDFFYVWLKRTLGTIYPELFSTPLSPKDREITEMAGWDPVRYPQKDKKFFEKNLTDAFKEIFRVLRPGGISIIVYAHKSTEGWETVINALLDSGLVINSAWPINTEMKARLRASESAALASSIYIVARKMPRQPTGFYNDVRTELRQHLDAKLHRLWEEGIGGADFFIAAIGSAIEVFGKYEQVMDYEGNIVRADRLLEEVRTIATDYAVRQILHDGFAAEISGLTRLYVLWRWNYGEAGVYLYAYDLAMKAGMTRMEANQIAMNAYREQFEELTKGITAAEKAQQEQAIMEGNAATAAEEAADRRKTAMRKEQDALKELQEAREKAFDSYQKGLADLARSEERAAIERNLRAGWEVEDTLRKRLEREQDLERDYNRRLEDIRLEQGRKQQDDTKQRQRKLEDLERAHQLRLIQIQLDYQDAVEEALRSNDAVAILAAMRTRKRAIRDEELKQKEQRDTIRIEGERTREDQLKDLEQRRQDALRDYQNRLADMQLAIQREDEEKVRQNDRDKILRALQHKWALEDLKRQYQEELAEAEKAYLKQREEYAQFLTDMGNQSASGVIAISNQIANAINTGSRTVLLAEEQWLKRHFYLLSEAVHSSIGLSAEEQWRQRHSYLRAEGGVDVVNRPTNFVAGEAGPEIAAFIPLRHTMSINHSFGNLGVSMNGQSMNMNQGQMENVFWALMAQLPDILSGRR